MKIKVNKTITDTVNIELPYYCMTSAHFYKVINKKSSVQIYLGYEEDEVNIGTCFTSIIDIANNQIINEAEFEEALKKAQERINNFKNKL